LEIDLMPENCISKTQKQKLQLESVQFIFGLAPQTILSIDLAAPACGKSPATFRVDVTRRPSSLPKLTRLGGRVFVRVEDLLAFINPPADPQHQAHQKRKAGRPTNAQKVAGGAHGR
jgi:hypothetical protein